MFPFQGTSGGFRTCFPFEAFLERGTIPKKKSEGASFSRGSLLFVCFGGAPSCGVSFSDFVLHSMWQWVNTNGIPFWLVGEFTTHFRTYFRGWIGILSGVTGILTRGHVNSSLSAFCFAAATQKKTAPRMVLQLYLEFPRQAVRPRFPPFGPKLGGSQPSGS